MDYSNLIIITIGTLLLAGLLVDIIAKELNLPRVSLLLVLGFIAGPSLFDVIPPNIIDTWFPPITNIALAMVGFLLGNKLSFKSIHNIGLKVVKLSLTIVGITFIFIVISLMLFNIPLKIALLLAALSTATDPAATFDVVWETKIKSKFSDYLLNIVAIDDLWCLILFSMVITSVHMMNGHYVNFSHSVFEVFKEIGGAVIIGFIVGIPAAYFSGRIIPGEATIVEALGIVFFSAGLAAFMGVSLILTSVMLGMVIKLFAKHHRRTFHAIEGAEWPFMVLFFILAGSSFDIETLSLTSLIGVVYIVMRILARIVSGWLGGSLIKSSLIFKQWIGVALLPQAGLAIGLGLLSAQHFPEYKNLILPIILSSTIFFEIFGPLLTRKAIIKNA